jgi:uncharacterized RDD family membrane protein YckC
MQYVGLGRRVVAVCVDSLVVLFGFGFAIAALLGTTSASTNGAEFRLEGASALVLFAVGLLYFVAFEVALGATPGKLLFGVRVRTADGGRIGWCPALIRNLLRVVDVCFGLVGALLIWSTPRRQRLGDYAAGTVVVPLS